MLFVVRGDRPELSVLAARRDNELIEVEKRRAAFALRAALFAITEELVDGLGNRLLYLRRFALDDHDRQPVKEQHDVGDDVMLSAENPHLQLANCDETVIVAVLEVDEAHRGAFFTRFAILANACVFQQKV